MTKFLGGLLGVVIIAIAALGIVPHLVNWNALYEGYAFEQLGVSLKGSGSSVKTVGNIKGGFIPPRLMVNNLYVECDAEAKGCHGQVSVEKVELNLSFMSLILGVPKVKSVELHGLRTDVNSFAHIVSSQAAGGVGKVTLHDAVISTNRASDPTPRNAVYIKRGHIRTKDGYYSSDAELRIGSGKYNLISKLTLPSDQRSSAEVELSSASSRVVLSGKGQAVQQGVSDPFGSSEWILDARTADLSEFAQVIALATGVDVLGDINSKEAMSVTARAKRTEEHGLELSNLEIKSDSLSGQASATCRGAGGCDAKLVFSSIDLDTLYRQDVQNVEYRSAHAGSGAGPHFLKGVVSVDIDLLIKEIRYRGGMSQNLVARASVDNGKIAIDQLLLDLPGKNNVLRISGSAVHSDNDAIPRFVGTINATGDDIDTLLSWVTPIRPDAKQRLKSGSFVLVSNLYMAPRVVALPDIKLASNNTRVVANLKYKYGHRGSSVVGALTVSGFSTGGYNVENFDIKRDLTSFNWLRSIAVPVQLNIRFRDFTLGSHLIDELSFLANISNRRMSIEKINFSAVDSSNALSSLTGFARVSLSSQGLRPKILLSLHGDRYSSEHMWIPRLLLRSSETATGGDEGQDDRGGMPRLTWSKQPIDLSSLEGIDGSVSVKVGSLTFGSRVLKDFVLTSKLKEGVMSIDDLSFKQGKGEVKVSGNVGMGEVSSASLIVSATNVAIGGEPGAKEGFSGNVSVSGSLQTQGRDMLEWANAVKGKLKFAARMLNVKGVDFNGFITDLFHAENKSEIAALSRVYMYRGNTVFEKFDGDMTIDRGAAASTVQFRIKSAVGGASVHFMVPQFTLKSLCRFTFIPPGGRSGARNIDMTMQGYLWQPNPTFDIDRLYDIVRENR
ncbi:hypothetical protein ANPL_00375 [Anaplasma platys]|uniref:AsmA-like C-terminal domain-containing protein n=1 Tax=Anaplasma platys TaxID=949 RepID=A0A858PX82_9RICK|nr:AsmA-like C-terminal region-containing protein [Anaplasma platys]QJC27197.1 hypothetical protein ANPL_00375 [Anaplasma platys]